MIFITFYREAAIRLHDDSLKKEELNAVKNTKADWLIITLMIVVAVVMYGYLIPNTGNRSPPYRSGRLAGTIAYRSAS